MSTEIDYTEVTGPMIRVGVIGAATDEEAAEFAAVHLGTGATPTDVDYSIVYGHVVTFEDEDR